MTRETEETVTVPGHYRTLSACLRPLARKISQAFINRPVPDGFPREDLREATAMFDEAATAISAAISALNSLNDSVLAVDDPGEAAVRRAAATVEAPVDRLLTAFQELWRRPFPTGLEQGQYLASAVLEKPLRQLLEVLEQVVISIDDPTGALARYGSASINLNMVFQADEDVKRFEEWCNSVTSTVPSQRTAGGFGIGSLLAAFLLGNWWSGHDR